MNSFILLVSPKVGIKCWILPYKPNQSLLKCQNLILRLCREGQLLIRKKKDAISTH